MNISSFKRLWGMPLIVLGLLAVIQLGCSAVHSGNMSAESGRIAPVQAPAKAVLVEVPEARKLQVQAAYGKRSLHFEANDGQTDSRVKFLSRGSGHTLFLTSTELVLSLTKPIAQKAVDVQDTETSKQVVLRMQLLGANTDPRMQGLEPLPGKSNYLIGNDRTKWHTNVSHYAKVRYKEVYPGIDLVYYGNQGVLEYDFVVAPGADPDTIRLSFKGAEAVRLDEMGNLVLQTEGGDVSFRTPVVYQENNGERQEIPGQYVLYGQDQVGFLVASYDTEQPLVIDPQLVFSTYLGGGGAQSQDVGTSIAVDPDGNVYAAGSSRSVDFPTTPGVFQLGLVGGLNGFITKFDANGMVVYSTYLGSASGVLGITVDTDGFAYVTGTTSSPTFPTTSGAFDTVLDGPDDCYVAKLNQDGSDLVYSTYLGGSGTDGTQSIAVDDSGNAYLIGKTASNDFPTTPGAFDTSGPTTTTDAFVTKLSPDGSALVYSTFLGGMNTDIGFAIDLDASGNAHVAGTTRSLDFPTTANAFQVVKGGGFVTKLNADGSGLLYSTYFTSATPGIAVDGSGRIYVQGSATSLTSNIPTTVGAFQEVITGGRDAYLIILDPSEILPADQLVYATFVGGSGSEFGMGVGLDAAGNVYISGMTNSIDFPIKDATQATLTSKTSCSVLATPPCIDRFVTKLNPGGNGPDDLVFSTYLGGSDDELDFNIRKRIAVDAAGNVYMTGLTHSDDFPTVNAAQPALRGNRDAFVSKIAFDAEGPITTNVLANPNPVAVNTSIILTANVDDTDTGGSNISSADFSIDGVSFFSMSAIDGVFDEISEDVDNFDTTLAFPEAGVHNICVDGTDAAGNIGPVECILLAVFDPEGGFVTGGGWINSPAGAFTDDPTLTGKANFGFVSKYKKGANIPTGVTQFKFKVADLNFHSNDYEWLVVGGPRAQYKGTGTINGVGDFGFLLTAIDGQMPGGNGVDKFRIKIWDKIDESIVYDNKLGAEDSGDDATELGGGSIVIHK